MLLSHSKLTFSLKRKHFNISSFHDFFVFGILDKECYSTYIKINSFELSIFYTQLRSVIDFLTDTNSNEIKIILKTNAKIKYVWRGQTINNIKQVFIDIEHKSKVDHLELDEANCETLLLLLPSIFLSCLQITCYQKFFLKDLTKLNEQTLQSIMHNHSQFIRIFQSSCDSFNSDLFDNYELLRFYFKEILILNEINCLLEIHETTT